MLLPRPLRNAAYCLIETLMTLIRAVSAVVQTGSTPTFPEDAAQILLLRLTILIGTIIRIATGGLPTQTAEPATTPDPPNHPDPAPPDPRPSSGPAQRLPTRPGWLLAALPDLAPAIAADLAVLLADPAVAALLAADPTLHRILRPILRSLGLKIPDLPAEPPPQPDPTQPVGSATPHPTPPNPPHPQSTPKIGPISPRSFHAHIITISQ